MFDGINRPLPPRLIPPRPAPLNVYPFLPLLRTRAAEDAVKMLAVAAAENALSARRWVIDNWGATADLRDECHPARTAVLDTSSPLVKLAETQCLLSEACTRYQVATGCDGLAFAGEILERRYGCTVADAALGPLTDRDIVDWEIDAMLHSECTPPDPTPAQRQAALAACAEWMLSEPGMGNLADRLRTLQAACGAGRGDPGDPGTAAAIRGVEAAVGDALRRGCPRELLQIALDTWADATDGLRIMVEIVDQPSTHPNRE